MNTFSHFKVLLRLEFLLPVTYLFLYILLRPIESTFLPTDFLLTFLGLLPIGSTIYISNVLLGYPFFAETEFDNAVILIMSNDFALVIALLGYGIYGYILRKLGAAYLSFFPIKVGKKKKK